MTQSTHQPTLEIFKDVKKQHLQPYHGVQVISKAHGHKSVVKCSDGMTRLIDNHLLRRKW